MAIGAEVRGTFLLAGATATGKSAVVQYLAEQHGATLLSADAMLVYRGMDIGTAKPSQEERLRVPYYGLDCVTPAETFSSARWLESLAQSETAPLRFVTGGTGLYFSLLLRGLDPAPPVDSERRATLEALPLAELQARLAQRKVTLEDMQNPRRLIRALEILESGGSLPRGWGSKAKVKLPALLWPRALLHARIAERVRKMYQSGLLEETRALRTAYPEWSRTANQAIGYAEAGAVLDGKVTRAEAIEQTIIRTRQLARRQETYLRGQFEVTWIACSSSDTVPMIAERVWAVWEKDGAAKLATL
ncbi:MAG: tRNA (adenosine(37)-N6)-dimethylallyltransferase MiaA [Kiritimatiellia bacterium]